MPIDTEEFLRGIAMLVDNENMRVTLKQSGKGAAICGAMCFIGGLIGGPGLFISILHLKGRRIRDVIMLLWKFSSEC